MKPVGFEKKFFQCEGIEFDVVPRLQAAEFDFLMSLFSTVGDLVVWGFLDQLERGEGPAALL
jgi:hypothetical protein